MRIFVLVTSLIILALSYYPTFHHWKSTPEGRVWAGTTFYSDDYAVYVHTIHQGMRGRWTVVDKFTSEPHQGSLIHIYYLLAGKLFGILGMLGVEIGPIGIYHLLRLLASVLFLFASWTFVKSTLSLPFLRLISWTFICFYNVLPAKYFIPGHPDWLPWVGEPEVTLRFAGQSHHILGSAFLLLQLSFFLKFLKNPSWYLVILASSLSFVHSWTEPNTAFATLVTITLTHVLIQIKAVLSAIFSRHSAQSRLVTLWNLLNFRSGTSKEATPGEKDLEPDKKWRWLVPEKSVAERLLHIQYFLAVVIASAPALLYFRFLDRAEPWKTLFAFDKFQHFNLSLPRLLSALGIPFILSLLIFIPLIARWKKLPQYISRGSLIVLLAFIAQFLILYFASPFLLINRLRFYHQPAFVAFAALGSVTLYYLSSVFFPKLPKTFTITFTIIAILISTPATFASFNQRLHEYDDRSTLVYPTVEQVEAFDWLKENTRPDAAVLALYEASNLIPVFSNNVVYAGNVSETLGYEVKSKLSTRFYQNQINPLEAEKFISDGNIKYIYFGFQEEQGLNPASLTFLNQMYSNPKSRIFKTDEVSHTSP